jgi:hypothetical protein
MKTRFATLACAALAAGAPAGADMLTYRDGRTLRCVIEEETAAAVTVVLHGRRVEIPRSLIASTAREDGAENAALLGSWERVKRDDTGAPPRPPTPRPSDPPPAATSHAEAPEAADAAESHPPRPGPSDRRRELRWKQEVGTAIRERRVLVGMTEREVQAAWGSPDLTHPVRGPHTSTDRWTYRREGEGLVDLYFKNGVLTQINR